MLFEQEQQVHIRMNALFTATVSSQRDKNIGIPGNSQLRSDQAGFEPFPEEFVQYAGVLLHESLRVHLGQTRQQRIPTLAQHARRTLLAVDCFGNLHLGSSRIEIGLLD
jgi:hypothetical protein